MQRAILGRSPWHRAATARRLMSPANCSRCWPASTWSTFPIAGRAPRSRICSGYEASQWYGIGAPKNTGTETVTKLNREINAGLTDPKLKAQLADLGETVLGGSSTEFEKLIAEETEKWAKVVKFSGAKAD